MSKPLPIFDLNQIQQLCHRALGIIQSRPLECFIALSILACAGYLFRHALRPPAYPNIDGPHRKSFLSGHLIELLSPHTLPFHDYLQDTYGSVSKVYGDFGREDLYVSDPRFLHEVLVKSSDTIFRHPQYAYDINTATFGLGLLSTTGDLHKGQRKMLNPVFTIKHMKSLMATFNLIARNMKAAMIKDMGGATRKEIDILRWCSATALELVGQAGLGHTFGILEGSDSEYSHAVKNFLPALISVAPLRMLFPVIYRTIPRPLQPKLAEWFPSPAIQKLKSIVDVQDKQAQDILNLKKEALKDKRTAEEMHDIMSVLCKFNSSKNASLQDLLTLHIVKANMEANEKDRLPEDQLLGQMNTLIFAGHETTSGALARILQLLASNSDIQDRLRAELKAAPEELSYDELHALPYLDALCRETLRLFPPAPVLEREALKDWVVPLRYPLKGKDGNMITEIKVRKGTRIYVGLREANRCKETWGQDADEFKPERWLTDLPNSVIDAKTSGVYSSMMTFSAGPRACIGFKFSLLELKIVLSTLIKSFKFAPGTTDTTWLACGTMVPYPAGTKDYIIEKKQPYMPLTVSVN